MKILQRSEQHAEADAWEALRKVSRGPNPHDITSNTQWAAVVFNNTKRTAEITIRRHWDDVTKFAVI